MALVKFAQGTYAAISTTTRDANTLYFTTDTHQIFLGENEYTKGTKVLSAEPTSSTPGEIGCLYAYNGSLYLCSAKDGSTYTWTRVANVNDESGTLTSITVGEGLAQADGDTNPITTEGTIKHAIPSGASTVADDLVDQTPAFGSTFQIEGVATDKFGHVTGVTKHTVTLPTETAVTVEDATGTAETLAHGSTFAVVTKVEAGVADQAVKETTTVFTLPDDNDTTYAISSSQEGIITLTPSEGSATTAKIDGWDDLAKKSELSAVFIFKGTVATVNDLPDAAEVGWVYHVTTTPKGTSAEYVCITAGTGAGSPAVWEELGLDLDLSAYATTADIIPKVLNEEGEVPKWKADGTLESTGFTLGISVPADAVFTDTTYEDATTAVAGLMSTADKAKLDGIESGAQVNTITGVKGAAEATYRTGEVSIAVADLGLDATTAEINLLHGNISQDGSTVEFNGLATYATNDGNGNDIATTYATKEELSWQIIS